MLNHKMTDDNFLPPPSSETPPGHPTHKALAQFDKLVWQARTQDEIYQNTRDPKDLNRQIELYQAALDCVSMSDGLSSDCTPAQTPAYEDRAAIVRA